jgi:hypothetical protein
VHTEYNPACSTGNEQHHSKVRALVVELTSKPSISEEAFTTTMKQWGEKIKDRWWGCGDRSLFALDIDGKSGSSSNGNSSKVGVVSLKLKMMQIVHGLL